MWQFYLSYLLQLGYKTITDNHALLLGQGHNCHHTIITYDQYQDALLHSVLPRPIPSISVCNIEKLGMGLHEDEATLTCISAQAAIMKCMLHAQLYYSTCMSSGLTLPTVCTHDQYYFLLTLSTQILVCSAISTTIGPCLLVSSIY